MEKKEHYRHELKYTINYWQYLQLRSRFRQVMKMDPHTRADGTYSIRSIYFDNIQDKLLNGDLEWMKTHSSSLVQELYGKMKYQQLRPRVLVSYTREPYIYAAGNVRITFDWNVRTTMYHGKFLEKKVYDVETGQQCPGEMIMEVKYDAFLPGVIQNLIQTDGVRQESFSKYAACRTYG